MEFFRDIKETYKDLIEKKGFDLSYVNSAKVSLSNYFLGIEFNMDRMELQILIRFKGDLFRVNDIMKLLYPQINWESEYERIYDKLPYNTAIKCVMGTYAYFIEYYLLDKMKESSDWLIELKRKDKQECKIKEFIRNNFPPGHELIYLMYAKDNWLSKVITYFEENNINYPKED